MKNHSDILIVGSGIAGSVLVHEFFNRGIQVTVCDQPGKTKSSRVAAGLYNPVVFKRMTKTWKAETALPIAEAFYQKAQKNLQETFFHQVPMARVFSSVKEQNDWQNKLDDSPIANFIADKEILSEEEKITLSLPFGYGAVIRSGYLNTSLFLNATAEYLKKNESYHEEVFLPIDLKKENNHWTWKGNSYRAVIFCEGVKVLENPWFSWVPINPLKGEVLVIRSSTIDLKNCVNGGCFILPLGSKKYKVGATFNFNEKDETPTGNGRLELIDKLTTITNGDFKILSHDAGLRPTVKDRRPLVGAHPLETGLYIFNGLGTRGVLHAPFLAAQLADLLEGKETIHPESNISRYYSLLKN